MIFCYALIRLTLHQFFPTLQRLNSAKPLHFQKKQIGFIPRFIASIQAQPIFCKDMLWGEIKRIKKYYEKGAIRGHFLTPKRQLTPDEANLLVEGVS